MTAEIECAGCITKPATIEVRASYNARDGVIGFGIGARYKSRTGDTVSACLYETELTPIQAHRLACCIRELADGNVGDFYEAGLEFTAGEYSGCEIALPHCYVWIAEDTDVYELAEALDKAAKEAGA
ncbi:MAG: hypothetical protein IKP53_08465 [Candidatus Methanomethylophilaceae archaeon]|nr:hypothetical protein [Candidatus Methanomethylophilaceae archaeon]